MAFAKTSIDSSRDPDHFLSREVTDRPKEKIMFGIHYVDALHETPVHEAVITVSGENRYCPVFLTRGQRAQYLYPKHEPSPPAALVAPSFVSRVIERLHKLSMPDWKAFLRGYADIAANDSVNEFDDDHDPEFLAYLREMVPALTPEDIANAKIYDNMTGKDLPPVFHHKGMLLVWNDVDEIVPKDHPDRIAIGEGPFEVIEDEEYLVAIWPHGEHPTRVGGHRIVAKTGEGADERWIIAHAGFFVRMDGEPSITMSLMRHNPD